MSMSKNGIELTNPSILEKSYAKQDLGFALDHLNGIFSAFEQGKPALADTHRVMCAALLSTAIGHIDEIKTIDDLADDVHANARAHGWYDEARSFGDVVALMHSELSEALEEHRNKKALFYEADGKPEGVATELVDCVIRILDTLRHLEVPIEGVLLAKHRYNITRPFRHGGKAL